MKLRFLQGSLSTVFGSKDKHADVFVEKTLQHTKPILLLFTDIWLGGCERMLSAENIQGIKCPRQWSIGPSRLPTICIPFAFSPYCYLCMLHRLIYKNAELTFPNKKYHFNILMKFNHFSCCTFSSSLSSHSLYNSQHLTSKSYAQNKCQNHQKKHCNTNDLFTTIS